MSTTPKTYEIATLEDIFKKVPADRIADCCKELGEILSATKATMEVMHVLARVKAESEGKPESVPALESLCELNLPMTWIDDGKGDLNVKFHANGENVLEINVKPQPKP